MTSLWRVQCQQKSFDGPTIGPKMAEAQHREWTEDELRANRQGIIGLQAGSNKGATQAGINMGKGRSINDWLRNTPATYQRLAVTSLSSVVACRTIHSRS